jgi:hypothetical protein
MIDLHFVVALFHKTPWTELIIAHEINQVPRENTITHLAVGKSVRALLCNSKHKDSSFVPESDGDLKLDDRIAHLLSKESFLSFPQSDKKVMIQKLPVDCHLIGGMGWKPKDIWWVPHTLTEHEKTTRVQKANEQL